MDLSETKVTSQQRHNKKKRKRLAPDCWGFWHDNVHRIWVCFLFKASLQTSRAISPCTVFSPRIKYIQKRLRALRHVCVVPRHPESCNCQTRAKKGQNPPLSFEDPRLSSVSVHAGRERVQSVAASSSLAASQSVGSRRKSRLCGGLGSGGRDVGQVLGLALLASLLCHFRLVIYPPYLLPLIKAKTSHGLAVDCLPATWKCAGPGCHGARRQFSCPP